MSSGLISYSADSSYNNVPFENLQSFFGVPAKGAGRFARDPHASIYRDVADSDSFTRIVVWFPDNHVPFNDCVTIIGKKFGKYDLIIRDFKKDETNRIAYWLSENISVEVEEDGSDVIVSIFSGKGIPGSLYSFY